MAPSWDAHQLVRPGAARRPSNERACVVPGSLSVGRESREKTRARILVRGRDQPLEWGERMARIASGSSAVSAHLVPSARDLTQCVHETTGVGHDNPRYARAGLSRARLGTAHGAPTGSHEPMRQPPGPSQADRFASRRTPPADGTPRPAQTAPAAGFAWPARFCCWSS